VAAAARGKRLTVASVVQAAWALLLGRHTRAGEVMFGVTSSGRRSDLTGFDRMIGLFINTLPQRVSLDPPAPLAAIAAAIQADAVRARRFEHVALVDLERGLATADPLLFDSVVVVDNFPQDAAQHRLGSLLRAGHPFADVHADLGMTEFPLRLEVIPGDPMVLALCHYTDRYSAAQARALLVEYAELLITICADLDAPAATLLGAREPADAQPGVTGDS
jgi:non-ribosomal peptide synthetase component F